MLSADIDVKLVPFMLGVRAVPDKDQQPLTFMNIQAVTSYSLQLFKGALSDALLRFPVCPGFPLIGISSYMTHYITDNNSIATEY